MMLSAGRIAPGMVIFQSGEHHVVHHIARYKSGAQTWVTLTCISDGHRTRISTPWHTELFIKKGGINVAAN